MDNRAIGVFDSGVGGLTSIPHLMKNLPNERVIYFGDTARVPYGSRKVPVIKEFAEQIADFLMQNDVKMLVIACNTLTAVCVDDLQKKYPQIPVVGIIEPAAERIAKICSKDNRIGLIATKVTVQSEIYEKTIRGINNELQVFSKACPDFVPLIEEGKISDEIMDSTIRYYMDDFISENKVDTIILGCTHYPMIRPNIEKLFPQLQIVNPSEEIAYRIKSVLEEKNLLAEKSDGKNVFYASNLTENFKNMIDMLKIGDNCEIKCKKLEDA